MVTACPFCSIMLKGAQTSAPDANDPVRRPDDVRQRPAAEAVDGHVNTPRMRRLAGVAAQTVRGGCDLPTAGYPADRSARRDAALAHRRPRAPRGASRGRPSADHGVLARPHPAGHLSTSAAAASSSSPARTSTANGSPASSSGSATAPRADRRRAAARKALLQLKRDMAAGRPAGFTVDGPRGPARVAQPGAVWLAKATGNPMLPFHLEAERHWTLRSWDRTQIPKPFARVATGHRRAVRCRRRRG